MQHSRMTKQAVTSQEIRRQPRPRQLAGARHGRPCYRLLHSTGESFIADRAAALARLARLPGAKLFFLPDGALAH